MGAIQQRCTQPVEKAPIHGTTSQLAVWPGVVEREHRLRAVFIDRFGQALVDPIQRFVPADRLELLAATRADTLEGPS